MKVLSQRPASPSGTDAKNAGGMLPANITNSSLEVTPNSVEDRDATIAIAAYMLAEKRGFTPGHEIDDWLAAEAEVDQRLMSGRVF
ncbi:MAG: DUF2934 domain-containing protein [Steroidobacteraceae bacterium]